MNGGDWLAGRRLAASDLRHDGNAFTVLRWLLAALVMFSHAWDLTQTETGLDPSVAVLTMPVSGLAVYLFFTLSGFLVTGSLVKRGVRDYALSRLLRMVPGLWVMLVVTALGLWLLFGAQPLRAYIADPLTLAYLWKNGSLLGNAYLLPGIFDAQPIPAVNGSLWTLPQEVRCYIGLALLAAVGLLRSRRWLAIAFVVGAAVHLALPLDLVPALDRPRRLAFAFFLGVLCYLYRDRLRLSWPLAAIGIVVALVVAHAAQGSTAGMMAIQLGFAYALVVAAFVLPHRLKGFSARLPDYSYGIYIYAFPAQQAVIALGIGTTPLANLGWAFALTLPVAAASWHLIESPMLRLKPYLLSKRQSEVSA